MIAYFIMAHHKPHHLNLLLDAIYHSDHVYMIHIDSKADYELHSFVYQYARFKSNVYLLPTRIVTWAAWSLVQVELDAIKQLLYIPGWTYFINLSGQDYPLVSQQEIFSYLEPDKNYLNVSSLQSSSKEISQGKYYVEDVGHIKILADREPFEHYFQSDIIPYQSSQWKVITRHFAEFAVKSELSSQMQDYFRYTYIPDETFFPTLLMNSFYRDTLVNTNFRFILLQDSGNVARPVVMRMHHLPSLLSSRAIFARKFDLDIDSDIIACLKIRVT